MLTNTGAVIIGRNEGERLVRCLTSVRQLIPRVVYVDSGSDDDSVMTARDMGVGVVLLDTQQGFTAARARNAGWQQLASQHPDVCYVQFIDGDCELAADWLAAGVSALDRDTTLAVVCGRRRERFPERSLFNRLCDMEWNTPIGEAKSCGGDALIRLAALRQVAGYNDRVIAGEEPEMCVRLRQSGWKIRRLDAEMTMHDAAMTRWRQWFRRSLRAGHAYAEAVARHGRPPERHGVRQSLSIWLWAAVWPCCVLVLVTLLGPFGLLGLLAYPLMALKIAASRRRSFGDAWPHCLLYGAACVLGKWPQWFGQLTFLVNRLRRKAPRIIEYKEQPTSRIG